MHIDFKQELSYRKHIARQLRTQYAEGIYDNPVTLKYRLTLTQGHWKRNHWVDHNFLYHLLLDELLDVEYYRDLETRVKGHSRSLKMAPFDGPYATFKSICLSVRYVPVSDENGLTYRHSFFSPEVIILVLPASRSPSAGGPKYRWGIEIARFSTNKSLYLANDTSYRHSYYGSWIENRT